MNHMDQHAGAFRKITEEHSDIYDASFPIVDKVTNVTRNTLMNNRLGLAGSIAYVDNGAKLYENFKRSHMPEQDPSESTAARLITTHKSALLSEISDIERLIVVGGGSYESISSQELALVSGLFAGQRKPKLTEIVLIDVSTDFIHDCERAIGDFQAKHKKPIKVIPVRADFKDVSGETFDHIMQAYGSRSRADAKAAVMMTGATFGNIESVSTMDKFPGNEVDVQMAHLADLVGIGSTVMFDHFTKFDTSEKYYDTPELAAFFNNIPVLMKQYCKGLQDFHVNGDNDQQYFRYRARQLPHARMIAHELVAEAPQKPKIVNGVERVFPLSVGDTLNVMFSLQARADDITWRPVQNTGLESQMSVTHKDLQVMHVFRKVGIPGALHQDDETSYQAVDQRAHANGTGSVTQVMQGLSRIIRPAVAATLRPLVFGGAAPAPAA